MTTSNSRTHEVNVMRKAFISWGLSLFLLLPISGCVTPPADEKASGTADQRANSGATSAQPDAAQTEAPQPAQAPRYSGPIEFADVTTQAGLHFKHNSGAFGK